MNDFNLVFYYFGMLKLDFFIRNDEYKEKKLSCLKLYIFCSKNSLVN